MIVWHPGKKISSNYIFFPPYLGNLKICFTKVRFLASFCRGEENMKNMMKNLEVYHDESYRKKKKWFIIGLLWISPQNKYKIIDGLRQARERNNHYGKIHYRTLTDHSPKRNTAIEWFQIATEHLKRYLWFYLLAVNRFHPMYQPERFGCHFHEYNRFTSIALFSSFRWFFPRNLPDNIVFFSDSKTRRPGGDEIGDGITSDNFEEYLCKRFAFDMLKIQERMDTSLFGNSLQENNEYSNRSFLKEVRIVKTRNELPKNRSAEEELVQLCDLLLGSFGSVMTRSPPSRNKKVKQYMYMRAKRLVEDIEKKPWKQRYHLYKRLWVGCFPDQQGKICQGRIFPPSKKRNVRLDKWM